jgi:two-component system response regulator FlrC
LVELRYLFSEGENMPGSGKRVLVIDDACLVADTLMKIFLNEGYEARSAYSAEEALKLLEREAWIPALPLIDVQLPGMNGVDLAILLKAKYPSIRLRLLSGHAMTTDRIEAARQNGYLFDITAKPTHPTVFLELASSL